MSSSDNESAFALRCRRSLEHSLVRRGEVRRARRRRLRVGGGAMPVALMAIALALLGAGAAVGQQKVSGSSASAGLLAKGSKGPAVRAVQRALGISADGVFDGRMKAVVKRFQRRHGLLVDGVVGPQTRGALGLGTPALAPATGSTGARATSSAGSGSTNAGPTSSAGTGSLQGIAQCESGGNPQAVGGGGQYRGKYQFTQETWRSVGGSGDPAAAPEAEQDRRAVMLYQRGGSSSWPVCGR
jgi:Transglycosylase-like domain/Putative peptidoglycan binding domain